MARQTSARPNQPYVGSSDATAARPSEEVSSIDVGEAVIEIDRDGTGCVAMTVSIGQNAFFGLFDAAVVTRWCAETSVIMTAALEVGVGDELAVRSPMLVAQHHGCLALHRRVADGASLLSLRFASSEDDLGRGDALDSGPATVAQASALLAALQKAAAAAATQSGSTG